MASLPSKGRAEVPQTGTSAKLEGISSGRLGRGKTERSRSCELFERRCSRFDSEHNLLKNLQAIYVIK